MRITFSFIRLFVYALFFAAQLAPNITQGQTSEVSVPPALSPWVDWVLDQDPIYRCTWVDGGRTCDWPGVLEVRATTLGATFTQKLEVDRKLNIALPGNDEHWPEDVRADGKAIAIENVGGFPHVTLAPGTHTVSGNFVWPALPDGLHVPAEIARVDLWVDGDAIRFSRRSEDGKIWLAKSSEVAAGKSRDGVELEVYRKLTDGIPPTLETVILVRASGRARELNLGNVLPQGVVPMNVTAGLPVQIDGQTGDLRLQLRAGSHQVRISARVNGDLRSFKMTQAPQPWPTYEVWSWQSNEALRQVELTNAPGIDPARTSMPSEWRSLPAFSLGSEQELKLDVLRRGQSSQPPNQLHLTRQMWLDLSGDAFTIRDAISGSMKQDWRLDLEAAPLGHVSLSGEDQLITQSPQKGSNASGIEVRDGNLDLKAEWRLQRSAALPAVGWSQDMQQLNTTLHLPPGWSLLAANGVDQVPNTWVARWNVYGFFFVLLVALAIGKLAGWRWLPVALVGLVLAYHEDGMPLVVWVVLLVFAALLRVLPAGVWRILTEAVWAIAAVILVLQLAPFVVTQVREAMYPQIENRYHDYSSFSMPEKAAMDFAPAEEPLVEEMTSRGAGGSAVGGEGDEGFADDEANEDVEREEMALEQTLAPQAASPERRSKSALGRLGNMGSSAPDSWKEYDQSAGYRAQQKSLLKQDPNAVISTGPGVYNWQWKEAQLSWSGPVARDHNIKLWLLSPTSNLVLTFVRVLCLLALAIVLLLMNPWRRVRSAGPSSSAPNTDQPKAAAAAALLFASLSVGSAHAQTAMPSPELLTELRARLTRAPDCGSTCVELGTAAVRVQGNQATLEIDAHAATDSAVLLPGPAKSWVPEEVRVDGRASTALRLDTATGFVQLKLPAGKHTLTLQGTLPPEDAVTLEFAETPHRVTVTAPEWEVIGVREDGRISGSLQLQRRMDTPTESGRTSASRLPPWFILTRRLEIGVRWSVTSTLVRQTPIGSPEVVRIPLLPGESITESDLEIENGELVVSLGRDEMERTWTSSLSPNKALTLLASKGRPWSEVWQLTCGPIWRCTADEALAPVSHLSGTQWSPVYRPWPGEKLSLTFVQPKGVKGATTTVDEATLELQPGNRRLSATLRAKVRTSQGGPHKWTIPKDAAVQSLTLNGSDIPIEMREGVLQTTLTPGENSIVVSWQQNHGMGTRFAAPKVSLGAQAVNLRTEIMIPQDRWLLWASGPSWGPAILFWSHFFLILLLAAIAWRIPRSPLRLHEWILLGLGLTQVPTWVALILAGWFFALAYRRAHPFASAGAFNVTQLALVFYTLVAIGCFYAAVHTGLLVDPDWQVEGQGSHNGQLNWYQDRSDGSMPSVEVLSLSLGWWRGVMLAWALWLAWKLLSWLKWGWESFSTGGRWKKFPKRPKPVPARPVTAAAGNPGTPRAAAGQRVPAGVTSDPPPPTRARKDTPRTSLPPEGLGFELPEDDSKGDNS